MGSGVLGALQAHQGPSHLSQKLQVLGSLGLRVPASPRPRVRRREHRGGDIAEACNRTWPVRGTAATAQRTKPLQRPEQGWQQRGLPWPQLPRSHPCLGGVLHASQPLTLLPPFFTLSPHLSRPGPTCSLSFSALPLNPHDQTASPIPSGAPSTIPSPIPLLRCPFPDHDLWRPFISESPIPSSAPTGPL